MEFGGREWAQLFGPLGDPNAPPPALSPSFHRLQWEGSLVSTELSPAWPRAICLWVVNPPRKWEVAWNPHQVRMRTAGVSCQGCGATWRKELGPRTGGREVQGSVSSTSGPWTARTLEKHMQSGHCTFTAGNMCPGSQCGDNGRSQAPGKSRPHCCAWEGVGVQPLCPGPSAFGVCTRAGQRRLLPPDTAFRWAVPLGPSLVPCRLEPLGRPSGPQSHRALAFLCPRSVPYVSSPGYLLSIANVLSVCKQHPRVSSRPCGPGILRVFTASLSGSQPTALKLPARTTVLPEAGGPLPASSFW